MQIDYADQRSVVKCGTQPKASDIRAPMRVAFDELSAAISTAYAAVDVLAGRLDPVLVTPNDGAEGSIRPSHSAPLFEEAHQLGERVHKLASTVREITDRLVL